MVNPGRIPCQVPYCRRTAPQEYASETICQKHWRGVSARTKWAFRRVSRRLNSSRERPYDYEWHWTLWDRAKREAIEAAGGIG